MRTEKLVRYLAIALSIAAVVTGSCLALVRDSHTFLRSEETSRLVHFVAQRVASDGVTADMNELVASGDKPKGWLATVVLEEVDFDGVYATCRAVAASDPNLMGLDTREIHDRLEARLGRFKGVDSVRLPVKATDGSAITALSGNPYHVAVYGVNYYGHVQYVGFTFLGSAVGAWLAVALWVVMDARQRSRNSAAAWGLLSLLTGPVALGVWLISRPASTGSAPVVCPSCGSAPPAGAAYCVRCGNAIAALCPKCARHVELDWSYCGHCGTPLADPVDPGDK